MIRVLLCDDHDVVRAGLRSVLESAHDVQVVGEAADGRAVLDLVPRVSPNIVVMDITMPGLSGFEATRRLCEHHAHVKVLALSMHSDRQFVLETLRAGASGYLVKDTVNEHLVNALRWVAKGGTFVSPQIADVVVEQVRNGPDLPTCHLSLLTARERDVLQLLAEGKTSKEIAQALHVSPKTVESHRGQIMDKLGVRTVAELTKFAIREGLTSL